MIHTPMTDVAPFFDLVRDSLQSGDFVKVTLSRPQKGAPVGLRNLFLRPVEIRGERMVAWTHRYERREEVKNYTPAETVRRLRELCGAQWRNADVIAREKEATLTHNRRGEPAVFIRAAKHEAADARHDHDKARLLDPASSWLRELGITGADGGVLPSAQAKWRQINKFLEIAAALVRSAGLPDDARLADMGCGKGYLTFALHEYLRAQGQHPHTTGVELRPELVALCNAAAQRTGCDGLTFTAGGISDWQPARLDMLIALHACDTATDDALAAGVRAGARVLVVAPCCHKQVRRDLATPHAELSPLLDHGILAERQSELLTDTLRALLLETHGYRTSIFEFVSTEHTAKNVMITAIRRGQPDPKAAARVAALKEAFGLRRHCLEELLAELPAS